MILEGNCYQLFIANFADLENHEHLFRKLGGMVSWIHLDLSDEAHSTSMIYPLKVDF